MKKKLFDIFKKSDGSWFIRQPIGYRGRRLRYRTRTVYSVKEVMSLVELILDGVADWNRWNK